MQTRRHAEAALAVLLGVSLLVAGGGSRRRSRDRRGNAFTERRRAPGVDAGGRTAAIHPGLLPALGHDVAAGITSLESSRNWWLQRSNKPSTKQHEGPNASAVVLSKYYFA